MADVVRLTDFRMAGFLVSRGARFIRVETSSGDQTGEVTFVFAELSSNGTPPAEELLMAFPGSLEERDDAACRSMQTMLRLALKNRERSIGTVKGS